MPRSLALYGGLAAAAVVAVVVVIVILVLSGGPDASSPAAQIPTSTPAPTPTPTPPTNRAPELAPIGDQTVALGSSLTLKLSASDPEGEMVSFSVSPLPLVRNASLNVLDGSFAFKPDAAQAGSFELTFQASDGQGGIGSETVTITVEPPPPGSVTALTGIILDANDFVLGNETPVVGATVSLLGIGKSAVTDAEGRFVISGIPGDTQVFDIDTTTASAAPDGSPYAGFRESIHLIPGARNVVDRPFFLPRIDTQTLTPVNPGETTVVTSEALGVTLTVPPNAATLSDGSDFTGELSISVVPMALAPAALPENLEPGLLITIQPVGVTYRDPVPITFPNIDNLAPGSETDLWSLDPEAGEFVVVGTGRVSADGSVIEMISGGIRANDWHAALPPAVDGDGSANNSSNQPCGCERLEVETGSATAIHSGNLSVDHTLPSYMSLGNSNALTLNYNSTNADPRPIITSRSTILARAAVPETVSASLVVAGLDQAIEIFTDTSGIDESVDQTILQAFQFDASAYESGAYPYRLKLTSNYPASSVSSRMSDAVIVNNQQKSPFGSGWTLDGLQRLHIQDDWVTMTSGDGSALLFANAFDLLLEGSFDTENNGIGALNYEAFENWSVSDGAVDLIGNGFFDFFPGNGLYIDLDGSASDAGIFESVSVRLTPGDYILEFNLAGSQRGDSNTVAVTFGDLYSEEFTLESSEERDTITRSFRALSATTASLRFDHAGGDNFGRLLDDVILKKPDPRNFMSPPGDFSTLIKNNDGTLTRTLKDGIRINFSARGLQTSVVDRNGNTTAYTYDAEDRLIKITDAVGLTTTFAYRDGLLASITDPANRTTKFEHDIAGNLTRITDPDGASRQFKYNARHLLTSQTSKRGFVTEYKYDLAGRNIMAELPDGSVRRVSAIETAALSDPDSGQGTATRPAPIVRPKDALGSYTDGNGNNTVYKTNSFGSATESVDPLGRTMVIDRDANNIASSVTSANGAVTVMTYDDLGNLLSIIEAQGQSEERLAEYAYEPVFNRLSRAVDPSGGVTTRAYDKLGNLIKSTNPIGGERTFTYDERGLILTNTDESGNTVRFAYDDRGNLAKVTDALGNISNIKRDEAGNTTVIRIAVGSPEERATTFSYDALNRLIAVTDDTGATTEFRYDAAGNITAKENATGEITTLTYDEMDRVVSVNDPIGGITQLAYDFNSNLIRSVDALGATSRFEYDAAYRVVKSIDALGGEQLFKYDAEGNVISFEDGLGQVTTFEYDIFNRQVKKTDSLGFSSTFDYDSRDNIIRQTDQKGQIITFTYDALTRLIQIVTPDDTIVYTYDGVGNLLTGEDSDSGLAFTYDALNRLATAQTLDMGHQPAATLTYSYDAVGDRRQLRGPEGGITQYTYDSVSRLTQLITPAGNAIDLGYDPAGRLKQTLFPNEVASVYRYDPQGRLASLSHIGPGTAVLANFDYGYNPVGNILSIAEPTRTLDFTYDVLQQVTTGGTADTPETYSYDSVGNRTASSLSATYGYDGANRLLEDNDFTYKYDANGNLATKTARSDGALTEYGFDTLNQLVEIVFPDTTTATYRYDILGRRIEKNVNGSITRYVYDGIGILLEYDEGNSLVARYSHGDSIDQPLSMERDGESYFYHADQLGSIRRLTDASGAVVNSYDYDTYGRMQTIVEGVTNPFGYTGRERDPESGLYYNRARYYDPQAGRFISSDPLPLIDSSSQYAYVRNNPVNSIDPLGLFVYGIGVEVSVSYFAGQELSIDLVFDDDGNVGLLFSNSFKGGFTAGIGIAAGPTFSTADTIDDLSTNLLMLNPNKNPSAGFGVFGDVGEGLGLSGDLEITIEEDPCGGVNIASVAGDLRVGLSIALPVQGGVKFGGTADVVRLGNFNNAQLGLLNAIPIPGVASVVNTAIRIFRLFN